MFVNTKADEGPCELIHSDELKEAFENSGDTSLFDDEIERGFSSKISDIDRVIKVRIVGVCSRTTIHSS